MNRTFFDSLDGNQPCTEKPHLFFPGHGGEGGSTATHAKQICRTCPHQTDCLQYALSRDLYGIWGATTQKERRAYQRARNIQAPGENETP